MSYSSILTRIAAGCAVGALIWGSSTLTQAGHVPASILAAIAQDRAPDLSHVSSAYVAPKSLADLVRESDRIVVGRVAHSEASWHANGRLIFTHASIAVEQTLKGDAVSTATVSTPGGIVGKTQLTVSTAQHLRPEARMVLFLNWSEELELWVATGASQGKFEVVEGNDRELVLPTARYITESYVPFVQDDNRSAVDFARFQDVVRGMAKTEENR